MDSAAGRVFDAMGTVVSVRTTTPLVQRVTADIEAVFSRWNDCFSLYAPESELSRVAAGTIALTDASALLRTTYAAALDWRTATHGAFTPHRPDGVIDLNGIVKALTISEAAEILDATTRAWMINCGGDVLVRGDWTVGIANPADRSALLASVRLTGATRAVATSGSAERGNHIWGRAMEFDQVTVIADDIVTADVLATAIVAGGRELLDLATGKWPIEVLALASGELVTTPGIRTILAASAR